MGELKSFFPVWLYSSFSLSKDIIQLHISCPSDKEEEKSTKDVSEKEDKDKNKEKVPRKMLSRGKNFPCLSYILVSGSAVPFPSTLEPGTY